MDIWGHQMSNTENIVNMVGVSQEGIMDRSDLGYVAVPY